MYEHPSNPYAMSEAQRVSTDAKFALLTDAFSQIDTDHSGQLSRDELVAFKQSHRGSAQTDEAVQMALDHFDDVRKLFSATEDSPNVDSKELASRWFGRDLVDREKFGDEGISLGDLKAGRMSLTKERDYEGIQTRTALRTLADPFLATFGMFATVASCVAPDLATKAFIVPFGALAVGSFYDMIHVNMADQTQQLEKSIQSRRTVLDSWYWNHQRMDDDRHDKPDWPAVPANERSRYSDRI